MNTTFLLIAQYDPLAIIPHDRVCADYFSHLTGERIKVTVAPGNRHVIDPYREQLEAARGLLLKDLET